ncbi:MAG TPA: sigma-54 dependent transcriptional regulator [Kofleriaceae bacterium]|nr:sigma-54 dependent transcriptional regulator [Kofleriaceae bacterium]
MEREARGNPARGRRQRGRILIVDDQADASSALARLLRDRGYLVETARDGFKALPKLKEFGPDLLLTDLRMPGMDGLSLMRRARELDPDSAAIVMTAYGALDTAMEAMRHGALDYVTKPIHVDDLIRVIEPVLERRRAQRASGGTAELLLAEPDRLDNLVGSSPPMRGVFETVLQVAPSRASVLITGESGTGKELIAAAIHRHSTRAGGPFVRLHCAALAETLLESELFGHERGAFTGAAVRREGRFQQADGGTLFLDEIGEIAPSTQIKLLRFLQEREFERVGGNQTIKVDLRIVAATNRDLRAAVHEGCFREDLYYRINVVSIEVPPLRERDGDTSLLATHFLHKYAAQNQKRLHGFTTEAMDRILRYPWPGNVRELENAVERAVVVCRGGDVRGEDLPPTIRPLTRSAADSSPPVPGSTLAVIERHAILATLEYTGGCTSRAAAILGISPRTIQYRLREYSGETVRRAAGSQVSHLPPEEPGDADELD